MFKELFQAFQSEGEQLFLVGGFVRDFMHARMNDDIYFSAQKLDPSMPLLFATHETIFWNDVKEGRIDIDFATSAIPEKTIEILKKNGLKVIPIGIEFGTIQTSFQEQKVEITTFRCNESYKKGSRKPSVQWGKTIEEDLARRDFTMNAMAMGEDGKLIDPFCGYADLIQGLLATPIEPEVSFMDDPLRMLRAYRFVAKKGVGIEYNVGMTIRNLKKEIHMVSAERIFDEMSKILMTKDPGKSLEFMARSGLLGEIFPELQKVVDFKQNQGKWHSKLVWPHTIEVVRQAPQILEVRWAALFHDVAKPQTYSESETGVHFYQHDWKGALVWDQVAQRLRVSKEFRDHVHVLVYEHLQPSLLSSDGVNHTSDKALRRLMVRVGDKLDNLFHLSLADITSHKPEIVAEKKANCMALWERCKKLNEEQHVARIKLPTGTGLVVANALGIKPGRQLGDVMKKLEQMLIDGDITVDADFAQLAKEIGSEQS